MPAAWGDRERGAGTYNREGRGTNGLLWGGGVQENPRGCVSGFTLLV